MRAGKISEPMLKRSVLKEIKSINSNVLTKASVGEDSAVLKGGADMVTATTTVTLGEGDWGYIGVNRVINDIACNGGDVAAVMMNISMPEKFDEKILKTIMRQTEEVCKRHGIQIAGGHTEITDAVVKPVVSYTGIGYRNRTFVPKVEAGQKIILTKWLGMEGSYIAHNLKKESLRARFPGQMLDFVQNQIEWISVKEEADIAIDNNATFIHNLSNGGVLNALWELSVKGKVGLEIDFKKFPMRQEVIEVCEFLELNLYRLLSGGSLLIVTSDEDKILSALNEAEIPAVVIGKTTDSNDKILINEDEIRYLDVQNRDDLWSLIDHRKI